jgi:Integrase zinc binding domain
MCDLQRMDPTLQPIIDRLLSKQDSREAVFKFRKTKYLYLGSYKNEAGIALRVHTDRDGVGPINRSVVRDKVVVPAALVKQVIGRYHDHKAHPGATRTDDTLREVYWWPSHTTDVESYVHSYQFCRYQKVNTQVVRPPTMGYTGPYAITRRFSPVLYEANIDGKLQRIHILKMQRDPINEHFRQHIQKNCVTQPLLPSGDVPFQPHLNATGIPFVPTPTNTRPKNNVISDAINDTEGFKEAELEDDDEDIGDQEQDEYNEDD